jgi:RNA exonuclease 4
MPSISEAQPRHAHARLQDQGACSPFLPLEEHMKRCHASEALYSASSPGSPHSRKKGRCLGSVHGGRLWMWIAKSRRSRADAAVRRYLAAGEGERGCSRDSPRTLSHPGVAAATFKAELRASLRKLKEDGARRRAQAKEDSDDQMSEASTRSTMGEVDAEGSLFSDASSADSPSSPLEEICDTVWDEVTNKAGRDFENSIDSPRSAVKPRRKSLPQLSGCLAIDCEMVGVGKNKARSILARVAVVDERGTCLLDSYVRPTERITDYRTRWSGIRARDLVGAPSFDSVRQRVAQLVRGKILVGHAIHNDLRVLNITHPPALIRDTAFFSGLRRALAAESDAYNCSHCPSLKSLCQHVLKVSIQGGEHCPVEDATATMKLYMRFRSDWEAGLLFA